MLRHILKDSASLTPAELEQVKKKVREYANQDRWGWLRHFLPGFLPIVAIPFWVRLRKTHPLPIYIVLEVAFAGVILWFVLWNLHRAAARHAFRAVRDLGFADICPRCGYNFKGISTSHLTCPECGTESDASDLVPPTGNA